MRSAIERIRNRFSPPTPLTAAAVVSLLRIWKRNNARYSPCVRTLHYKSFFFSSFFPRSSRFNWARAIIGVIVAAYGDAVFIFLLTRSCRSAPITRMSLKGPTTTDYILHTAA